MSAASDSAPPPRPLFVAVLVALAAQLWAEAVDPRLALAGLAAALGVAIASARYRVPAGWVALHGALLLTFASVGADVEPASARSGRDVVAAVAGTLAPADLVRIEGVPPPARPARGPVTPPGSPAGASVPALPDQLVRVETRAAPLARGLDALRAALGELRAACVRRTDALESERARSLVRSLVFGDARTLPFETADLFTRTGTRHLLAVSGLHVSLVVLFAIGPLSRLLATLAPRRGPLRHRERVADLVRLLALVAVVGLAGARAPALRAAASVAFGRLGLHLRPRERDPLGERLGVTRRADTLSVWALALAGECVAAGGGPLSLSVRLSYGATLGLILGTGPVTRALRRAVGLDHGVRVARAGRAAWLDVPLARLRDLGLAGVAASLAASSATLPFVWREFGEWSPVGLVLTPLVLPLFTLVLLLAWAWLALPLDALAAALDAAGGALLGVLELADALPGTPVLLPRRPDAWLAATGCALLVALLRARARTGSRLALRVAALSTAAGLLPWTSAPSHAELHLLDVGHGTAAVLRAPCEPVWLFDAGSRDRARVARGALLPLLAAWDTRRVRVVASHADRDHGSALPLLTERFDVELWAGEPPESFGATLAAEVPRLDARPGSVRLPTSLASGLELELRRPRAAPGNEGSRSLAVRLGHERALLTGDAEGEGLRLLAAELAAEAPLAVLLLPHHGSDGPWFGRLLDAARPAEVWISAGSALTVEGELERRRLAWRSTAREGPLLRTFRMCEGCVRSGSGRGSGPSVVRGWHGSCSLPAREPDPDPEPP